MSQRVESGRFPYLPLRLDLGGSAVEMEALIDTGFDGALALPPGLLPEAFPPVGFQVYGLADGSQAYAALYRGTVSIGALAPVVVEFAGLGSEPILGREVTDRYAVLLDRGRRVVVEP